MHTRSVLLPAVALAAMLLTAGLAGHPAAARDPDRWPVEGRLLGPDGRKSRDVSGLACAEAAGFPRRCLAVDDNLSFAQEITLLDGRLVTGPSVRISSDTRHGRDLDLDGEGVAFADGFFYVVGSHGHPRDRDRRLDPDEVAARTAASSQIVRLRARPDGGLEVVDRSRKLADILAALPDLAAHAGRRLDENGLTIEGIAVRADRIFLGFRAPVLKGGRAAILSVARDALFGSAAPDARLFRLPVGSGSGVRDLAPWRDGFLVLTGPAGDDAGSYSVFAWDGRSEELRLLANLDALPPVGEGGRPEALLPLDSGPAGLRLLVLFDGTPEGTPTAVTVPDPGRP